MPAPERPAAPAPPRRAGWHIAGSVAAWGLPLATAIVAMPFLWRTLGRDGYGVYILAAGYAGLAGALLLLALGKWFGRRRASAVDEA